MLNDKLCVKTHWHYWSYYVPHVYSGLVQ